MSDNIAKAWDSVKSENDAPYDVARSELKEDLARRAESITKTGSTNYELMGGTGEKSVYDKFEDEFKRLRDAPDEEEGLVLDTNVVHTEPAVEEEVLVVPVHEGEILAGGEKDIPVSDEPYADEQNDQRPLDKLKREELDKIAQDEFGFNPSDFSNKGEIVAAIEKARGEK